MKKLLAIVLSALMAVSVLGASSIVFAADINGSPETVTQSATIKVEVNGSSSDDVIYEKDPTDPTKIKITYTGKGTVTGWEFLPDSLVEGVDYVILEQDGNSITIQLLDYDGEITVNAIVEFDEEESTQTTKKSDKNKSPKTGAAATGLAVAGAGVAILTALKKKDDAE